LFANRLVLAVVVVVGVPAATIGYVALADWLVGRLPPGLRPRMRPWVWLTPALLLLILYLLYPSLETIYLSFLNFNSTKPAGILNYIYVFTDSATLISLRNNVYWLLVLAAVTVILGLLIAVALDRVRYESFAKAIIFLPLSISFVAASIIWKLQYDYQPASVAQTGTLNGIIVGAGGMPVPWLINRAVDNWALIWVGIWMWTGFSMVILSAGLKGIPHEIIEAARVDGATEGQVLRRVTIPMLSSTIAVVATTMFITALKTFDIVYVLTNGNFGTDVIALRMYKEMFDFNDFGRASAEAVILLVAIIPIMVFNIRQFQQQEERR
jgi:alpha-glucoside transport system permease protein